MRSIWVMAFIFPFSTPDAAISSESEILSYDTIFFEQTQPRTAFDMIARLPGFSFDPGILARGFAGTAGNVLIDGQHPTSKTDPLVQVLQRIPAGDVQRIDVIRGGAPSIDMQGHSVVANIIRKRVRAKTIVVTAENDFFTNGRNVPSGRIELNRRIGATNYEGSLSAFRFFGAFAGARGHRDLFTPSGALLRREDVAQEVGGNGGEMTGTATRPLFGGVLRASALLRSNPQDSYRSYTFPDRKEIFDTHTSASNAEAGVTWKGLAGGTDLQMLMLQRLSKDALVDRFDDSSTERYFSSRAKSGESISRITLSRPLGDILSFESGAEGTFNLLEGHTRFAINGMAVALPSPNVRVEERRGEIFAHGIWKRSEKWLFELGARFEGSAIRFEGDGSASRSFYYPKPRALFTWSWNPQSQLRLRYETVVGQLNFDNFIATSNLAENGITSGNGTLRPDRRQQYEIAFEQYFWDRGALVAAVMHEDIQDVVDFVPVVTGTSVFDAPGNIGGGRNQRIEASLTLPLDKFHIAGGRLDAKGTWNLSRVRDPVSLIERVISNQPQRLLNIKFSQDLPRLKSSFGLTYLGMSDQRRYRLGEIERVWMIPTSPGGLAPSLSGLGGLGELSAFWHYRPAPSLALHVEVMNATGFLRRSDREIYAGARDSAPVASIQRLTSKSAPIIAIQVRRTFH